MTSDAPLVVVLFGAPGTGKSTLLHYLATNNCTAFYFVTVDEPTQKPAIVALLQRMYEQTADDINAGKSVTLIAQREIMWARCAEMKEAAAQMQTAMQLAAMHGKRLVVVFDGHVATDAALYAQAKYEAGEMSDEEFAWYCAERDTQLADSAVVPFDKPGLFVELFLDGDADGSYHHYRVATLRQSEAERNVQPGVYKRLATYAGAVAERLKPTYPAAHYTKLNTWDREPLAVYAAFLSMLCDYNKK